MAAVVAVAAVVPAVASVVWTPIINRVAAMATVINGWNHFGRWGDCTGRRPGPVLSTDVGCQTPSEWTRPSAHAGKCVDSHGPASNAHGRLAVQ